MATQQPAVPNTFPSPFAPNPHPIARQAAVLLQTELEELIPVETMHEGKMFGVLVVSDQNGELGYLRGFSGMLDGHWLHPGFVPPVFDCASRDAFLIPGEKRLKALDDEIDRLSSGSEYKVLSDALVLGKGRAERIMAACRKRQQKRKKARRQRRKAFSEHKNSVERARILAALSRQSQHDKRQRKALNRKLQRYLEALDKDLADFRHKIDRLKQERRRLSQSLQRRVFEGYSLVNWLGEASSLSSCFHDAGVPGGAGDCAGPKLIQYAIKNRFKPIAMAEFWWGPMPESGIRHSGQFYPACRGKCRPILPFMLRGVATEPEPLPPLVVADSMLNIVYQDDELVVVDKPAGLLSVPGKEIRDSVLTRLRARFPHATGPLLVHRLDLGTSGLLIAALSAESHQKLQKQFLRRSVEKRYIAILEKKLDGTEGEINLPLRVDLDDRPRQVVCWAHGKKALTRWRLIASTDENSRVEFFPLTGRTHQLRLHAAHTLGLNAPILGDELYGSTGAARMMLHAEWLRFLHPRTNQPIEVRAPAPF